MQQRVDRRTLFPLAIGALAILLVAYFDLQTNFPIVDEYARRWTIQRLADGRGLAFWGQSPNLVQILTALPLALLHLEPRFWRLAGLPFVALAGLFAWLIARRLGADKFWASVAAATVMATPMGLSLATGMMTETAFIALLLGASWFSLRWISEGQSIVWTIVMVFLATLQREQAVGLAIAITLGLVALRSGRPLSRRDIVGAVALWALVLGGLAAIEGYRRLGPGTLGTVDVTGYGRVVVISVGLAYLVVLAGFVFSPFLVAMLRRPSDERKKGGRSEMLAAAVGMFAIALIVGAALLVKAPVFKGDIWDASGLGVPLDPTKPHLLPRVLFAAIEVLALVTVAVVLVWRRRAWRPSTIGAAGMLLVMIAAIQFGVVILHGELLDRYFLPVYMPLVPLVAAQASRSSPRQWGAGWAVATMIAGLALYVVGEQDHLAWLLARDKTAQLAYSQTTPDNVAAGFEEAAVNVWIPATDNPNANLPRVVRDHPKLVLVSVGPDDPRPGFTWSSISPGKVVIQVQDEHSSP